MFQTVLHVFRIYHEYISRWLCLCVWICMYRWLSGLVCERLCVRVCVCVVVCGYLSGCVFWYTCESVCIILQSVSIDTLKLLHTPLQLSIISPYTSAWLICVIAWMHEGVILWKRKNKLYVNSWEWKGVSVPFDQQNTLRPYSS